MPRPHFSLPLSNSQPGHTMFRKFKDLLRRSFPRRRRDHQATPVGGQPHPQNAHQNPPAPSGIHTTPENETADSLSREYFDSAQKLRRNFPQTCSWLEPRDLDFTEEGAVAGGRYADVRRGRLGGRGVAVKSYRCYIRFDCHWVRMVGCEDLYNSRAQLTSYSEIL